MKLIKEHPTIPDVLVSSEGEVYIPKSGKNKAHWTFGSMTKNGYRQVSIYKKHYYVHRLVAETFIPNPDNKPFIDHKNRIRTDNNVNNLQWATIEENNNNTAQNRPNGKRLKDFSTRKEYDAARARDRYNNEPGYKEYHREYLKNWRLAHKD